MEECGGQGAKPGAGNLRNHAPPRLLFVCRYLNRAEIVPHASVFQRTVHKQHGSKGSRQLLRDVATRPHVGTLAEAGHLQDWCGHVKEVLRVHAQLLEDRHELRDVLVFQEQGSACGGKGVGMVELFQRVGTCVAKFRTRRCFESSWNERASAPPPLLHNWGYRGTCPQMRCGCSSLAYHALVQHFEDLSPSVSLSLICFLSLSMSVSRSLLRTLNASP